MSIKTLSAAIALGVLLVMLVLFGIYQKGYSSGFTQAGSDGKRALSTLKGQWDEEKRQQLVQQNAALKAWQEKYVVLAASGQQAEATYLSTLDGLRNQNRQLQRKIDDVTTKWIDEKGKVHPVDCVFTRGFVQQYNSAFGVPTAATATVDPGTGSTSGPTDTTDSRLRASGITQRDILSNITDNGGQCQALKAQVNGLLDYIEGMHQ